MSEIEYVLTATVDGVEVYRQSTPLTEVIEMSIPNAENAVHKELNKE